MSWLDGFLTAYNAIRSNGAPVAQEQVINFKGSGVNVADNAGTQSTDVTIATVDPTDITTDLTFAATVVDPTVSQATRAGTGANLSYPLTVQAQNGQAEAGSAANNNGGSVELVAGNPGTGGSGAAGSHGEIGLNVGTLGARVSLGNINGGGAETETHLSFKPTGLASYVRVDDYVGTGTSAGHELDIFAQNGQAQTGGANNNAGGDLNLVGGNHGTGGGGTVAERGKVRIGVGSHALVNFSLLQADTTTAIVTSEKANLALQVDTVLLRDSGGDLVATITQNDSSALLITVGLGSVGSLCADTVTACTWDGLGLHPAQSSAFAALTADDVAVATGATFVAVANLAALTLLTLGGTVEVAWNFVGFFTTVMPVFHVFIDGADIHASVKGLEGTTFSAFLGSGPAVRARVSGLAAGSHTFELRVKSTGAAGAYTARPFNTAGAVGESCWIEAFEVIS